MPVRTRSKIRSESLIKMPTKSHEKGYAKEEADDIMLFHLFDINETTVKELFPGLGQNSFIDTFGVDISRLYFTKYCLTNKMQ